MVEKLHPELMDRFESPIGTSAFFEILQMIKVPVLNIDFFHRVSFKRILLRGTSQFDQF